MCEGTNTSALLFNYTMQRNAISVFSFTRNTTLQLDYKQIIPSHGSCPREIYVVGLLFLGVNSISEGRVAIGEEVIKGVANEIGFISTEGDRGRSVFVARLAR